VRRHVAEYQLNRRATADSNAGGDTRASRNSLFPRANDVKPLRRHRHDQPTRCCNRGQYKRFAVTSSNSLETFVKETPPRSARLVLGTNMVEVLPDGRTKEFSVVRSLWLSQVLIFGCLSSAVQFRGFRDEVMTSASDRASRPSKSPSRFRDPIPPQRNTLRRRPRSFSPPD